MREPLQQTKRQHQPVRLLRIQRQVDVLLRSKLRQFHHHRIKLTMHALSLYRTIGRMQRRQLYGNPVSRLRRCPRLRFADLADRIRIALEIAPRIRSRSRALAQHVERMARRLAFLHIALAALQRFINRTPHHELSAHDAHRLHHGAADHRLARLPHHALHEARRVRLGVLRRLHNPPRQHQPPGGRIHQQRVRLAAMVRPIARRDLLGDQRIRRVRVRHAQQRLGQAHQRQPLWVGQPELLKEAFHHAGASCLRPRLQNDVTRRH